MFSQRILPLFRRANQLPAVIRRNCQSFKCSEFKTDSEYFKQIQINQDLIDRLVENDKHRKSRGDIKVLQSLFQAYSNETNDTTKNELRTKLTDIIKNFPNETHPTVLGYGIDAGQIEIYSHGDLFENPNPKAMTFDELTKMSNTMRMDGLGNFTGRHSYYLMNSVAELEQALIRYTVDILLGEGFELMSVPDILPDTVIEGCGMDTKSDRHQVRELRRPTHIFKNFGLLYEFSSAGISSEAFGFMLVGYLGNGIGRIFQWENIRCIHTPEESDGCESVFPG